jgi:uncharacterized protein
VGGDRGRPSAITRVGVVSDTHCPEFLDRLPDRLAEVLAGADLILHAGDVGSMDTLDELGRIAPVKAVRGDHDPGLDLPERLVVEIGSRRIGMIHGNRPALIEEPATLAWTLSLGTWLPTYGLHAMLEDAFPDVDAVVYGHTHYPDARRWKATLHFNPGAVHQWTPGSARERLRHDPGWFEWTWLQVIRHRRRWPPPSVGMLEVGPDGIVASTLLL